MNNITYAVSVDVNNPIIPYNVYVASVLDSNVRCLEITLYQNGNVIELSNTATATASLVTDNVLVNGSVNCTISHNIITVPLEDLQRHGNLDVQVTVTEGTKVLAIPFPIQVRVTPNIAENAQIDENSLGSYAEVVHEIAEARGTYTTLHDAIATKLDNAANAVKTMHITDGEVTEAKLAAALRTKINAKMDTDDATVYRVDTTTQTLTYDNTNPKTIYLNARVSYGSVSNRAAVVISTSSKSYQFAITVTGDILMRGGGGTYPTDWTVLYGSSYKKNSINDDNKNSSVFIPTIGAVVSYLAANYIGNGSGTVTENNLTTALKNSLYRVDNTTETVAYSADNPRTIYTNARVNGNKPTLVFTLGDNSQLAMYKDGNLYRRTYANGAYGSWIDLKATSIGESNKTSGAYPTVQAVYNFVTAFVASAISGKANTADVNTALDGKEDLSNKVPNRTAMDNLNSETQYPSIKTMVQYTDEKVLGVIDSTLSTQGAAADAKTTGDKISALESLNEPYNLYDPSVEYTITNAVGRTSENYREYVINPDGSITCTAYAQNDQRLLRNGSITLTAGTYTISGKMTLNDNVTDTTTQRLVRCRIGINATVKDVALTTERGGDINVATNASAGWFKATFDLAQAEPLSFEMIPYYAAYGGTDHPCTIRFLQIIPGDQIGPYSPNTAMPADLIARTAIEKTAAELTAKIDNDTETAREFLTLPDITFIDDYGVRYNTGALIYNETYSHVVLDVSAFAGGAITGYSGASDLMGIAFYDGTGAYISGFGNTTAGTYAWDIDGTIPPNAAFAKIHCRKNFQDSFHIEYDWTRGLSNVLAGIADARGAKISVEKIYDDIDPSKQIIHRLKFARHVRGNSSAPLTLLHFSDIHADTGALSRIMSDAEKYGEMIDGMICTGDIVGGVSSESISWWEEDVMICIGNHDCATYNGSYNWTALSMAERSEKYIEPFESNWGITHTSGTSYYYKDYAAPKVRLIVIDCMLYNDNGNDAATQTDWLESLLSDAINSNLHVLIAIHAPHGGAIAKECSFSRYGQTAMPTNNDCNTPDDVINAVAAAITGGLHFIGYLCGHTHQDNIWDAAGDGSQIMYCVTCGAVRNPDQWKNSDQHRDDQNDAFNLVTIDTAHTLVKIVRGGGADIDDHMRTRKAICFDYSTGTLVGEVL